MHNRHQPYAASVEAGYIRRRIHHFELHEHRLAECNDSVTFLLEETCVLDNLTDTMCWEWSQRIYHVVGVNAHPGEIQERRHFKNRKIKVLKLMPCALYNTQYFKRFSLETSLPLSYINTYTHIQIHLCSEFEPPEAGRPALGEGDPVNSPLSSLRSTLSFILSSIPSSILGRMQCRGGNEIQYRRPVLTGHLQDSSDTDSLYNLVGSSPTPHPGTGAFWHLSRCITIPISSVSTFPRYPAILPAPLVRSGPLPTACLAPGLHFFAPTDSWSAYSCFSFSLWPAAAPANACPSDISSNWSECGSTILISHSSLLWTKGSLQWEKGMMWPTQGNFLSLFL